MPLRADTGPVGPEQAERLLRRSGFGPRPGEGSRLAAKRLDGAVEPVTFEADGRSRVITSTKAGSRPITSKQIDPSARTDRTLRLPPGRYSLWYPISNHRARGKHATLLVQA